MTDSPTTADALIVVDLQRAFVVGPDAVPDAPELVSAIDSMLRSARAADALVVHLQNEGPKGSPDEPGTSGWELVLPPRDDEAVIRKRADDPFIGTTLENLLREHRISALALGGLQSEMCVAATARGALARGLSVILPHDAHATYPIPYQGPHAQSVSAKTISRVAEWSLGDEIVLTESAQGVLFR